jgi:hypothetical protein
MNYNDYIKWFMVMRKYSMLYSLPYKLGAASRFLAPSKLRIKHLLPFCELLAAARH